MASLGIVGGIYIAQFRFAGQRWCQSLSTTNEKEARRLLGDVEDTLALLNRGRLTMPDGITKAEVWRFIRSGGRQTTLAKVLPNIAHEEAWRRYFDSYPEGSKAATSLSTETTHKNHFLKKLGKVIPFQGIDPPALRNYVKAREKEDGHRGKKVAPNTINKELGTFRQLWQFIRSEGLVMGDNPVDQIRKPRGEEREPFKTFDQIKKIIDRGGLTDHQQADLWGSLFLRAKEVADLLDYVEMTASEDYIYPMFSMVALTGCRRSEMMRSEIGDWSERHVKVREKKRKHGKTLSFRQVDLHPRLKKVMTAWFDEHPGGRFAIARPSGKPLSPKEAVGAFKRTLKGSKWTVMPGFHTLRHSFASILAMAGKPQAIIDAFMGHTTEEMRERYRHLFPEETAGVLGEVF